MSDWYNHCTKCGDELTETEREVYAQGNPKGPILCKDCVEEILIRFNKAIHPLLRQVASISESIFTDIVGNNDE